MKGRKPITAEHRRARGDPIRRRHLPTLIGGRQVPPMPHEFYSKPGDPVDVRSKRARLRAIWIEQRDYLAGAGVLDKADGPPLRHLVVQLYIHEASLETILRAPTGLLTTNSQGVVPHPLLAVIDRAGKEIRMTAEQLPLSPWGRSRLNLHGTAPGGQSIDDVLGGPSRPKLVVDNDAASG